MTKARDLSNIIEAGGNLNVTGDLTSTNITATGYIAGPASFVIDPAAVGDNTGTLVVAGNLQVDGTTTTINSTTMTVNDLNITLASGAENPAAANGAGLTVDGASATLLYTNLSDSWSFNKNVGIGTDSPVSKLHVSGNITIDSSSNAPYLDFVENGDTGDSKARIAMDQISATSGQMLFYTEGSGTLSERMRIDSSGGIFTGGIETGRGGSTTSHLFHIDGTSKYYFELQQTDTSGNTDILFSNGTDGDYGIVGYEHAIDRMQFYTKSLRRMVIDQNGNVGIGTTTINSTTKLEVASSIARTDTVTPDTATVKIANNLNDGLAFGHYLSSPFGSWIQSGYLLDGYVPEWNQGYPISINPQGGNVGIGTSNPLNKFVVAHQSHGVAIDYVGATLPDQAGLFTSSTAHTQTAYGDLNIKARSDYGPNYGIGLFTANSANAPTLRMKIAANGNVGIGVSPEATIKLDVSSGAITTPARFRFSDDNNGATNNILAQEYFAGIEIENVYSGAAPSANGTKIAKLSLTTVTAGGYSAGGSIHTEATSNNYDAGELVFSTGSNLSGNNTERMRITSDGTAIFKKPVAAGGSSSYAAYSGVEGFSTNANTTQTLTFASNTGSSFLLEVSFAGYASAGAGSFVRQVIDGGHPGGALYHHAIQTASSSSGYTLGTLTETSNGFTFTVTSPGQSGIIYAMYKYVDSDDGLPTFTFV